MNSIASAVCVAISIAVTSSIVSAQSGSTNNTFAQLQQTAPKSSSGAVSNAGAPFDQLQTTAPRAPFDQLQDTAPRAPFDQLQDTAPRQPFDRLQDSAPRIQLPSEVNKN